MDFVADRVETVTETFLSQLCGGSPVALTAENNEKIALKGSRGTKEFSRTFLVLSKTHMLRNQKKHISKRDLYYNNVNAFNNQANSDKALDKASALLSVPRYLTNIVPSPTGLVSGAISFTVQGLHVAHPPHTAQLVPAVPEEMENIVTDAGWVLIVEKEAVFSRLVEDGTPTHPILGPGLVITGKGYPDLPTRVFLRRLLDATHIPAFCLVDGDPHGYEIYTTYKDGGGSSLAVPLPELTLIGITHADVVTLGLECCLIPLGAGDAAKAASVKCRLTAEEARSLMGFVDAGVKCEIEALNHCGLTFIHDEYLPAKMGR